MKAALRSRLRWRTSSKSDRGGRPLAGDGVSLLLLLLLPLLLALVSLPLLPPLLALDTAMTDVVLCAEVQSVCLDLGEKCVQRILRKRQGVASRCAARDIAAVKSKLVVGNERAAAHE